MKTAALIAIAFVGALALPEEALPAAPTEAAAAPGEAAPAPEEGGEEAAGEDQEAAAGGDPYTGEQEAEAGGEPEPEEEEEAGEPEAKEEEAEAPKEEGGDAAAGGDAGKYEPGSGEASGGDAPAAESGGSGGETPAAESGGSTAQPDGAAEAGGDGEYANGSNATPDGAAEGVEGATNPNPDEAAGGEAPVYDEPSQKNCAKLYVDVLETHLSNVLEGIDQSVIDTILELFGSLLGSVTEMAKASPESVTAVVTQVSEMVDYCEEHVTDEAIRTQVSEILAKAKGTYEKIYEAHVDAQVFTSFEGLWTACENSEHEEQAAYIEECHDALAGYVQAGQTDTEYTTDIESLCKAEDENVQLAAQDTKDSVKTLSAEAEAYVASASTVAVGAVTFFGIFLSAIF